MDENCPLCSTLQKKVRNHSYGSKFSRTVFKVFSKPCFRWWFSCVDFENNAFLDLITQKFCSRVAVVLWQYIAHHFERFPSLKYMSNQNGGIVIWREISFAQKCDWFKLRLAGRFCDVEICLCQICGTSSLKLEKGRLLPFAYCSLRMSFTVSAAHIEAIHFCRCGG